MLASRKIIEGSPVKSVKSVVKKYTIDNQCFNKIFPKKFPSYGFIPLILQPQIGEKDPQQSKTYGKEFSYR